MGNYIEILYKYCIALSATTLKFYAKSSWGVYSKETK